MNKFKWRTVNFEKERKKKSTKTYLDMKGLWNQLLGLFFSSSLIKVEQKEKSLFHELGGQWVFQIPLEEEQSHGKLGIWWIPIDSLRYKSLRWWVLEIEIGVWSLFKASPGSKKMVGNVISSTRLEHVSLSLCAPPEMHNSFNHFFFFFFIDFRRMWIIVGPMSNWKLVICGVHEYKWTGFVKIGLWTVKGLKWKTAEFERGYMEGKSVPFETILKRNSPSGLTLELGWWHGIWPRFPTWGNGGTSGQIWGWCPFFFFFFLGKIS